MLITSGNLEPAVESVALETLLQLRTDGVILAGSRLSAAAVRAAGRAVPIALVTSGIRAPGVDTMATDDVKGAWLAVEHLVGLGHCPHRHGRRRRSAPGRRAAARVRRAMHALGSGPHIRVARWRLHRGGGRRGTQGSAGGRSRPTAICAANDLAAIGALNAIAEAGLEVPRDISVVGYDNTALAACATSR